MVCTWYMQNALTKAPGGVFIQKALQCLVDIIENTHAMRVRCACILKPTYIADLDVLRVLVGDPLYILNIFSGWPVLHTINYHPCYGRNYIM